MGYPRRPAYAEPRKRIDARATRRDIGGNLISQPGEMAFTGMRRGMGGEPLSGTNILTDSAVTFPRPAGGAVPAPAINGTPDRVPPATAGVPAPGGFPARSAMTTGNPNVTFKSPAQLAAESASRPTPDAARNAAMPGYTDAGPMQRRMMLRERAGQPATDSIMRQPGNAPGGVVTGRDTGTPVLVSMYGGGAARNARTGEIPTPNRIADNGRDVTKDYAPGGKFSSQDAPGKFKMSIAQPLAGKMPAPPAAQIDAPFKMQLAANSAVPMATAAATADSSFPKRKKPLAQL